MLLDAPEGHWGTGWNAAQALPWMIVNVSFCLEVDSKALKENLCSTIELILMELLWEYQVSSLRAGQWNSPHGPIPETLLVFKGQVLK